MLKHLRCIPCLAAREANNLRAAHTAQLCPDLAGYEVTTAPSRAQPHLHTRYLLNSCIGQLPTITSKKLQDTLLMLRPLRSHSLPGCLLPCWFTSKGCSALPGYKEIVKLIEQLVSLFLDYFHQGIRTQVGLGPLPTGHRVSTVHCSAQE